MIFAELKENAKVRAPLQAGAQPTPDRSHLDGNAYAVNQGKRLFRWNLPQLTLGPGVIGAFIAVWGVWSVLRNLPWTPFTSFYV